MAGQIQSAVSQAITAVGATAAGAVKGVQNEKQAKEKASLEAEAKAKASEAIKSEAQETAIEADLIRMGADPESARSFMVARELGLNTKQFGMIRKKGKFVGSYSSLAEKLSKDSLTDNLSSRVINQKGFAERVIALGGTREKRVKSLVEASKGGKK